MKGSPACFALFFLFLAPLFQQPVALACASCGSGGDDPLILYPNHAWRFYLAAGRSWGFQTVKADGALGKEVAPDYKDSLTLAVGRALREDAFLTVTVPYLQNVGKDTNQRSFGDPILAMRWTVVPQTIADLWVPQFQFMLSHKFAQARSQQESEVGQSLDVFGTGVPETKVGLDVFQGMTDYKMGVAYSFLFPSERNLGGIDYNPGMGTRGVLTLGYGLSGVGKVLVGLSRETREKKRLGGVAIENSDVADNGYFATVDYELTPMHMARLNYSQRSALFKNRNGSFSRSVSLAWLWGLSP